MFAACPRACSGVSFTGELGFEINVPADYGRAVWEAVVATPASRRHHAYGTEAMHVMRAEKGYIIVGQDTDGTVTPDDVGLAWAIGKTKKDFVGKRSLRRPDMADRDRKQLVGLLTENPNLCSRRARKSSRRPPVGAPAIGHVTSSYFSPTLGRAIALAMVAGGRRRMGETLYVPMPEGAIRSRSQRRSSMTSLERASMSDAGSHPAFAARRLTLPVGDRFALAETPAAARFLLRGARVRAPPGLPHSGPICRQGSGSRANGSAGLRCGWGRTNGS